VVNPFFLGESNDLAVSESSMRAIAEARKPAYEVRLVACDHLSYFSDSEGLQALALSLEKK
jgi:hypothetical protein